MTKDIVDYIKEEVEDYRELIINGLFSNIPKDDYSEPAINELAEIFEHIGYTIYYPIKTEVNESDHFIAVLDSDSHKDLEDDLIIDVSLANKNEDKSGAYIEYISNEEVNSIYDKIHFDKEKQQLENKET